MFELSEGVHNDPGRTGGGDFARGEFCGENLADKKDGAFFSWRNFGVTVVVLLQSFGCMARGALGI